MNAESDILEALLTKVGTLVLTPTLPVSYPGVRYDPVVGTPYLRVTYLPNDSTPTGIAYDSDVSHRGLMQLSVFWPVSQGLVKPTKVASQVVDAFPRGTRLIRGSVVVQVEEQPQVAPAIQEPNWLQVPTVVRWRSVTPNT